MGEQKTIPINSIEDLIELSRFISSQVRHNEIIGLSGPVGVGKSTFTKYFLLNYNFKYNGSPTFTIMNEYCNEKQRILHVDLYTKSSSALLLEIMTMDDHIKIVEWIENANGRIKPDILLTFTFEGEDRKVVVSK